MFTTLQLKDSLAFCGLSVSCIFFKSVTNNSRGRPPGLGLPHGHLMEGRLTGRHLVCRSCRHASRTDEK